MSDHISTPFGGRALSLGMVAAQVAARNVEGKVAHKWKTLRAITESRKALGLTNGDLVMLNGLLTFLPDTVMTSGELVVFPSNRILTQRTHGMAETTLRRHLTALVRAGIIIRRDSPNGKRYARKDDAGQIVKAYGFDLSPMLARADEFENLAAEAAAERRSADMARERVTLYRRDIAKMIETGATFGAGETWRLYREKFTALCHRLPRKVTAASLQPLIDALCALAAEVVKALENLTSDQDMAGSDAQDGAHIENSKPEPIYETEPSDGRQEVRKQPKPIPLPVLLKACPDIVIFGKGSIQSWHDVVVAAGQVSRVLRVSPSAWDAARNVMGDQGAAIAIAGILQRAEAVRNPGGYLRELTQKSKAGNFCLWPMMMALLRVASPS